MDMILRRVNDALGDVPNLLIFISSSPNSSSNNLSNDDYTLIDSKIGQKLRNSKDYSRNRQNFGRFGEKRGVKRGKMVCVPNGALMRA
jgi:hypothetical protein